MVFDEQGLQKRGNENINSTVALFLGLASITLIFVYQQCNGKQHIILNIFQKIAIYLYNIQLLQLPIFKHAKLIVCIFSSLFQE